MIKQTYTGLAVAVLVAGGALTLALLSNRGQSASAPSSGSESASPAPAEPVRSLPNAEEPGGTEPRPSRTGSGSAGVDAEIPADEPSLMAKLRRLGETNPELSLALARAGNDRYPGSPYAAERGWRVVKSLVNLKRFEEARAEAVILVHQHRGTPWAEDVARHLLVNPLTHPSERGYSGTDPPPASEP